MCIILESEVILANILSKPVYDFGVDRNALVEYCNQIRRELAETDNMSSEYIYFDITQQSIKKALQSYKNLFVEIGNRIFSYNEINVDYFNLRLGDELSNSLKNATDHYFENIDRAVADQH